MYSTELSLIVMLSLYCVTLTVSLVFWLINYTGAWLTGEMETPPCSSVRWIVAVTVPIMIAHHGLRRNSLDLSGALSGLVIGFVLTLASWRFLAMLLTFFITSSKATRFMAHKKRKLESDYKEGGQRNWRQVLCNGGAACQAACLYLVECGCTERPINFHTDYHSSILVIAVLGALSAANADTWASELGTVLTSSSPRLITTLKTVPKGTNGGVSLVGLLASVLGGAAIGVSCLFCQLLLMGRWQLRNQPPQWPLVTVAMATGLLGSLIDSLLGATLQYSGVSKKSGAVVETPGDGVTWISGSFLLDNHGVNMVTTTLSLFIAPTLAIYMWPEH